MPDETGTETSRSDAPNADDNTFDDAADGTADAVVEERTSTEETGQDGQDPEGVAEAAGPHAGRGTDAPEELKVVVSIKEGRATIGVQQSSSDPHIESFDDHDLPGLTQEVSAVVERARARWEESPKHPIYERPAPPAGRRDRRRQGAAQQAAVGAETGQAQQQTLRLF